MIRELLTGFAIVLSTLGGSVAAVKLGGGAAGRPSAPAEKLENLRIEGISVPSLRGGKVSGYVVASIVAMVPSSVLKERQEAVASYLKEAAFSTLYQEAAFDFSTLKPAETEQLAGAIRSRADRRLGGGAVKEVLIENLSFVTPEEIRNAQGAGR